MKLDARVRLYTDPKVADPNRGAELLAFVELVIEDSIVIKGLTISALKKTGEIVLSWPSRKGKDEKWYEVAHPITSEARKFVIATVLAAYDRATASRPAQEVPR